MTELVIFVLVFAGTGVGFLAVNLSVGRLVRPDRPNAEKETVYECGEPAVGSSWIQFDLRFYVVALLFVIFDVEMAFFFPWAVVFGGAPRAAHELTDEAGREAAQSFGWLAFADVLVFFGVLLVGFAYLWKRGDLDWVRSVAGQPNEGANDGVTRRTV